MQQTERRLQNSITMIPVVLFVFFISPCLYASHDTSLRTDLNFNYTINERFLSTSYIFPQANDNISNYDYVELGTGLQYQTSLSWLSFMVWYQQGYSKDDDNHWSLEQKPSINVNTSGTFFHFKISNQIRYEYRFTTDWRDYRIKNTLGIARPDIFLQPYIGWELFYENHDKDIMLNRIKIGIIQKIENNISLSPYYRMDFSKVNNRWEFTRQLFGLQMSLNY